MKTKGKKQPAAVDNPFVGRWVYRSLLNDPRISTDFDDLEFGRAVIEIVESPMQTLRGTIGGSGWELKLYGAREYGSPMQARFEGRGLVGGETWVYDYICWLVPNWPLSNPRLQRPALVGSVVRSVAHAASGGGTAPPGVTASFYAVRLDD